MADLNQATGQQGNAQGSTTATSGTTAGAQYKIPDEVTQKYPDLVALIKGSASMTDDERQYWFSILPIMNEEQVSRLRNILETEKKKLAAIDEKYQKQLEQINEKHLLEWQNVKRKEEREARTAKESKDRMADHDEAESLLEDELISAA